MDFPDDHARSHPDRVAYHLGDAAITYAELVDASRRVARLLRSRGLRRGDAVALLLPNMVGFFEIVWGCQRSGLQYTAISTRLNAADVAYILTDSGATVLVASPETADVAREAAAQVPRLSTLLCLGGEAEQMESLADLLPQQAAEPIEDECEGYDLLYSSGTTGRPKAIAFEPTYPALGTAEGVGPFLQQTWGFGADTVYLSPAPLYHAAPLRFSLCVQRFGGTVVVMERFDAEAFLALTQAHRVTHTQVVPTMLIRLLRLPEADRARYDLSSLRAVIHAAAPCPPAVKQEAIDWLGPIVDEYYSSTEASLMTLIRSDEAIRRPGSVGRPIIGKPHVLDEQGRELPPGVDGDIWSEAGLEFVYRNDPQKTAAARNDRGWTTIGDIGRLDQDGYLYLSDRRADLILSGGVNIYPQESENVLVEHPDVADVAVIGVPDDELGQRPHAFVELREGSRQRPGLEAELIGYCRERLSTYKCPRGVTVVAELPRTPAGKLMRRELRTDQHLRETS